MKTASRFDIFFTICEQLYAISRSVFMCGSHTVPAACILCKQEVVRVTLTLGIICGSALLIGGLWFVSMRLTPHRGVLRALEKLCVGIIICYCLALLLRPFGLSIPQSPISAALAGLLGVPGTALAFWIGNGF